MNALVLSGGGARGAYEAGVVSQLLRKESFDVVCGTSIGAINGALIAQRPNPSTLESIWSSISTVGVIKEIPMVLALQKVLTDLQEAQRDPALKKVGDVMKAIADACGLFPISRFFSISAGLDPTPVEDFLKQRLAFSQLTLPYVCAATNLTHGSTQVFYAFPEAFANADAFRLAEPNSLPITAETYTDVVRASGSIPLAFPPVEIGGSMYVDGGVANNTPVGQAVDTGADHITVIFMDPKEDGPDNYPAGNLMQIGAACYAVMSQTILQQDFDMALRTNAFARSDKHADKRVIQLREIRPKAALPLTILDFDKQDLIDRAFELGASDGENPPPYTT